MGEQIAQDRELLAAVEPDADAYRRLRARTTDNTTRLLNYEEILKQRYDNLAAAEESRRAQARAATPPVDDGLIARRDLRRRRRGRHLFHLGQMVDRHRLCPARRRRHQRRNPGAAHRHQRRRPVAAMAAMRGRQLRP